MTKLTNKATEITCDYVVAIIMLTTCSDSDHDQKYITFKCSCSLVFFTLTLKLTHLTHVGKMWASNTGEKKEEKEERRPN